MKYKWDLVLHDLPFGLFCAILLFNNQENPKSINKETNCSDKIYTFYQ